jgi:hypothetical protein
MENGILKITNIRIRRALIDDKEEKCSRKGITDDEKKEEKKKCKCFHERKEKLTSIEECRENGTKQ